MYEFTLAVASYVYFFFFFFFFFSAGSCTLSNTFPLVVDFRSQRRKIDHLKTESTFSH